MQKQYKTILLDLDNTLVDDDENRKYAIKQILIERNEEVSDETLNEFVRKDDQFWKDRADGIIKDPYIFKNDDEKTKWIRSYRFVRYFKDISLDEGWNINNKYVNHLGEYIVPIKDSTQVLEYLYNKGYEIYIVTNSPIKVVNNKLDKIQAHKYVSGIFTAEEAGHMKPHQEFFDKFFRKTNKFKTEEMLIIGDEIESDIVGGINNNIDSCWFNNKGVINTTKYKPTYEINNLAELKNIL